MIYTFDMIYTDDTVDGTDGLNPFEHEIQTKIATIYSKNPSVLVVSSIP